MARPLAHLRSALFGSAFVAALGFGVVEAFAAPVAAAAPPYCPDGTILCSCFGTYSCIAQASCPPCILQRT